MVWVVKVNVFVCCEFLSCPDSQHAIRNMSMRMRHLGLEFSEHFWCRVQGIWGLRSGLRGRLIPTTSGRLGGSGTRLLKRAGCAAWADFGTAARRCQIEGAVPKRIATGVMKPIPVAGAFRLGVVRDTRARHRLEKPAALPDEYEVVDARAGVGRAQRGRRGEQQSVRQWLVEVRGLRVLDVVVNGVVVHVQSGEEQ